MKKTISILGGVLMGVILMSGSSSAEGSHTGVPKELKFMSTPCAYEDSSNCYWQASTAGNGEGHSFYSIRIGKRDCIKYWNASYNRRHGRCYPISK